MRTSSRKSRRLLLIAPALVVMAMVPARAMSIDPTPASQAARDAPIAAARYHGRHYGLGSLFGFRSHGRHYGRARRDRDASTDARQPTPAGDRPNAYRY